MNPFVILLGGRDAHKAKISCCYSEFHAGWRSSGNWQFKFITSAYKQRWHLKQWCYITWRHLLNISERLLRMFFERPFMINSFSSRHRVQFRFPFLPAGSCLTMAHLIENCRFSFFRFQTCLDNSVSCLYFSLRRDFKWFLYLVL